MPGSHLSGNGCNKCSKHVYDKNSFITKASKVHEFKYDYSKVNYIGANKKVTIICPKHGEFYVTPNNHISGKQCPKCARVFVAKKQSLTKKSFINAANVKHNNKYDYSLTNYINYNTCVKIICPQHGEFLQDPEHHLRGHGCPKCKNSHLELQVENALKLNNIQFEPQKQFE